MKSAMTYLLIAIRGRYWMLNSLSSMAQSANFPAASGLLIARRKGLSVKTTTVWAWKYGLSLRVTVTSEG